MIVLDERDHPVFKRKGSDLFMELVRTLYGKGIIPNRAHPLVLLYGKGIIPNRAHPLVSVRCMYVTDVDVKEE